MQIAYNREHGIDPQTIRKSVTDILERLRGTERGSGQGRPQPGRGAQERGRPGQPARRALLADGDASTPAEAVELMAQLEAEMKAAAAELRYEEAALLRDEIAELRASVPG